MKGHHVLEEYSSCVIGDDAYDEWLTLPLRCTAQTSRHRRSASFREGEEQFVHLCHAQLGEGLPLDMFVVDLGGGEKYTGQLFTALAANKGTSSVS